MDLQTFFKSSPGSRQALAKRLDVTANYLWQIAVGNQNRKPSVKLAKRINAETLGAVSLESLRPDVWGDNENSSS